MPIAMAIGGLCACALGVYVVVVGLPPNFPIRLNGWFFLAFGALSGYIGIHSLCLSPVYLTIDASGVHLPKYKLTATWKEITQARGVFAKQERLRFIVLCLTPGHAFSTFKTSIGKANFDTGPLADDEVPIPFFGTKADLENVLLEIREQCGAPKS
jgi:hypothetical protein